ncbi:MAG: peptidase S8, partial [Chloroflexi bacterium]
MLSLKSLIVVAATVLALRAVTAEAAAPSNDNFATPTSVPAVLPYANTQSAVEATLEAGEPKPCGIFAATVWYSFAPTSSGTVQVSTAGSSYDTVLAVYTGNSFASLNMIDCNDDTGSSLQSAVQFSAVAGTTYRIQAGSVDAVAGDLSFSAAWGTPPAND